MNIQKTTKAFSISLIITLSNFALAEEMNHSSHKMMDHSQHVDMNENLDQTILSVDENSIYVCPMHPEEMSDKPGNCSVCGMHLEKVAFEEE